MLLILVMLFSVYVFTFPKYEISGVAITFFSIFYVTVMLSCIYRIRVLEDGAYMIVLVFLSAWGNDTLAYCAGRLFGKHKMSPVLSPKKTIEGAVGGVIGAGLLGFLYGLIARHFITASFDLTVVFAVVCAVGGLVIGTRLLDAPAALRGKKTGRAVGNDGESGDDAAKVDGNDKEN